jgi:hypothetical protein
MVANAAKPDPKASSMPLDPKLIQPPIVSRGQMLRVTSYSLLDESRVTEPGVTLAASTDEPYNETVIQHIPFEVNRSPRGAHSLTHRHARCAMRTQSMLPAARSANPRRESSRARPPCSAPRTARRSRCDPFSRSRCDPVSARAARAGISVHAHGALSSLSANLAPPTPPPSLLPSPA